MISDWWERRIAVALLAIALGLVIHVELTRAQPAQVTLAIGRVGGTNQEIQECYVWFGSWAMLALHPKGEPCVLARELIGRTGRLVFVPD